MIENPKSVLRLDFVTGTTVLEALSEMKEKAIQLNVSYVLATINDIDVYVRKGTNVPEAFTKFQDAIKKQEKFIVCV
jgi:hypothetical protein